MAEWPASGDTNWNTKMLAYLAIGHETDGTHGTKSGFQDRGDTASTDYDVGDLTTDGAWHDLNLATDVDAGIASAKAVALQVRVVSPSLGKVVQFRKNGNSNGTNTAKIEPSVTGISFFSDLIVAVDSSGIIEYNAVSETYNTLSIVVKGWWI